MLASWSNLADKVTIFSYMFEHRFHLPEVCSGGISRQLQIHAGCFYLCYKMSYHRISCDNDALVMDACGFQHHSNTTDHAHIYFGGEALFIP